jgi:hypothetical protein
MPASVGPGYMTVSWARRVPNFNEQEFARGHG